MPSNVRFYDEIHVNRKSVLSFYLGYERNQIYTSIGQVVLEIPTVMSQW